MKCPNCQKKMIEKHSEPYKLHDVCVNPDCELVSVIMTFTFREFLQNKQKVKKDE